MIAVVNKTTTTDTITTVGNTKPAFAPCCCFRLLKTVLNNQISCFFVVAKNRLISLVEMLVIFLNG